jgi:phenylacetate-CoA ligase
LRLENTQPLDYDAPMSQTTYEQRRQFEQMDAEQLARHQLDQLNALLQRILPENHFYADKLADVRLPLESLDQLPGLPYTYKDELATAHHGDFAANLTWPLDRYTRFHRTSGTRGRPIAVPDTAEDWQWWIDTWQYVLDVAQLDSKDRALMAFSFGPFIGFWSAFEAVAARGALVIPGGGMDTLGRLELIESTGVTAIFCTPTYALRMLEVAQQNQWDAASLDVSRIIVAGEPGGSVPAIRQRLESGWGARVIDHAGATEIGPWGYADPSGRGLHIVESEFIAEFLAVETGDPATEGELAELVLTVLNRPGAPVIRYRTGDLVRPSWDTVRDNRFVFLQGGVLGRADDMLVIRGVNIFPASIEQILRSFPEIVEYRVTARREAHMDALTVEVEDRLEQPERVSRELRLRLGLRIVVQSVPLGSLPRFEGKGHRFVDQRE